MEITSILIVRLMIIGIYFVLSNFSSFFKKNESVQKFGAKGDARQ